MVATAENAVTQLSAEITEDQQSARQLLNNVVEFVGHIKAVLSQLNAGISTRGT